MNCHVHREKDATGTCVGCGKFACDECITEIGGKNYCKSCVGELLRERNARIEKLEDSSNRAPMVFMNAGGAASSSSSSSSSSASRGFVCTKSKVTAGILAILLGGIGAHKFYLGQWAQGFMYLLFSWTLIPAVIGVIEGVMYFVSSEADFARRHGTYI